MTFSCTTILNARSCLLRPSQIIVPKPSPNLIIFFHININLISLDDFLPRLLMTNIFHIQFGPLDLWIWVQEFMGLSSVSHTSLNRLSIISTLEFPIYGFEQVVNHLISWISQIQVWTGYYSSQLFLLSLIFWEFWNKCLFLKFLVTWEIWMLWFLLSSGNPCFSWKFLSSIFLNITSCNFSEDCWTRHNCSSILSSLFLFDCTIIKYTSNHSSHA